ncbi:hypothetical protein QE152_g38265 [Popillia japonica]|uniref:Uncharacterized protein n=1 Tax=Popillia japonica TaxID=7064 RepID=A0AAW1I6M1_POPJA
MCYHLEKRTIEQEDLITMLKQYNYPCNATSETPTAGNVNNGVKSPQKKNPQEQRCKKSAEEKSAKSSGDPCKTDVCRCSKK